MWKHIPEDESRFELDTDPANNCFIYANKKHGLRRGRRYSIFYAIIYMEDLDQALPIGAKLKSCSLKSLYYAQKALWPFRNRAPLIRTAEETR
jgi:hypothetical protein